MIFVRCRGKAKINSALDREIAETTGNIELASYKKKKNQGIERYYRLLRKSFMTFFPSFPTAVPEHESTLDFGFNFSGG